VARNSETMIIGIDIGAVTCEQLGLFVMKTENSQLIVATYKKSLDGMDRGNIIDEREVANAIHRSYFLLLRKQSGMSRLHTLVSLGATGLSSHMQVATLKSLAETHR
jgi:cell division ATPase FtsA